jgi:HK97 gp10 family phage protein
MVADKARAICPVATGELRDSIEASKAETTPTGPVASVSAKAGHAMFVEMGTARMPPQPFLRPAVDDPSLVKG